MAVSFSLWPSETSQQIIPGWHPENRASESTDWLSKFLALGYRHGPAADRYFTDVRFQRVHDFWSTFLAGNEASNFLALFGAVLDRARELRNENNYEALLIAHEYRHPEMTEVFQRLATQMQAGARQVIVSMAQWYSTYLTHANNIVKSKPLPPAAEFIATYVVKRIEEPVRDWYSRDIAEETSGLIRPLSNLRAAVENPEVKEIERSVDWAIFNPKRSLMTAFRDKTRLLGECIRTPIQGALVEQDRSSNPWHGGGGLKPDRHMNPPEAKESKADLAIRRQELRSSRSVERLRLIDQLKMLTAKERLEAIARDQDHPIQYYPPELAAIETEQLMLLEKSAKATLLRKIEDLRKGPWKQLALRLRAACDE